MTATYDKPALTDYPCPAVTEPPHCSMLNCTATERTEGGLYNIAARSAMPRAVPIWLCLTHFRQWEAAKTAFKAEDA